ncbi:MAG: SUKH-3 domain-containing protein [Oscillospiraceae bacterium]|nr:SUKH-3 domain-containing protein [Oscillospiraceae bacterium]
MLSDTAKQQLQKAGWYEGRKIDVSHYEKRFTELGYEFFPAARRFLEEFGDLHIVDRLNWDHIKPGCIGINTSSTELEEIELWPMEYCGDFIEKVGKKVVPVAIIDHENIEIYISEDGKFYEGINAYSEGGLRAENSDQLWNEYYGAEEAGWASWEDLKAGKGRTMRKNNYRHRIYL